MKRKSLFLISFFVLIFALGLSLAMNPSAVKAAIGKATNFIGTNDSNNAANTSSVAANEDGSILERLEQLNVDSDAIIAALPQGMAYVAAVTSSADTTHSVYSSMTGYGTNFFKNGWTMIVIWDAGGANAAPETEVVDITAYVTASGTFTHGATTQLGAGDKVLFIRDELIAIFQKALPTIPVTNSLAYRLSQYLASGDGDWATGQALPSNKSLFDIIGDEYTDDGGDDNADSVAAHLNLISKYVADGDGDFATGSALPANKSLYDIYGAYTADGGADDEDTIMAHLDLIYADSAALDDMKENTISKAISTIANGNNDLFVVAGGPIKIIEIIGIVMTEIGSESCDIYYNVDPTSPAGDTAFGSDGDGLVIDGDTVGTLYTWDGVIANDLIATTNGVALGTSAAGSSGLIVPAGSLELTAVHDGTCAGAITVYLRYAPLVTGVTVTAAP